MGITKTLGGDRVGTGNKMKVQLPGYGRSTHDLGKVVRTTMTSGTVNPIYVEFVQKGDVWEIELESLIKTHPLNGPLFGSYKLQLDAYMADVRLYNRMLHNNLTGVGLAMDQVKFPVMVLNGKNPTGEGIDLNQQQIAPDSLLSYIGVRGLGTRSTLGIDAGRVEIRRNGIPLLMYWEIIKNYYSNKQEEKGIVIGNKITSGTENPGRITEGYIIRANGDRERIELTNEDRGAAEPGETTFYAFGIGDSLLLIGENLTAKNIKIWGRKYDGIPGTRYINLNEIEWAEQQDLWEGEQILYRNTKEGFQVITFSDDESLPGPPLGPEGDIWIWTGEYRGEERRLELQEFPLSAIDEMRERIFAQPNSSALELKYGGENDILPYKATIGQTILSEDGTPDNNSNLESFYTLSGLGVKTYQSDRFNNWLSTEWIDMINDISSVNVSSGSFTMDALNLAKKIYELSNRIAIAGNTYEDWLDAVWGTRTFGNAEMPVYLGGYSEEIVFDEVISSSAASDGTQIDPLGTLGGTGKGIMQKGGRIRFEAKEHGFLMIVASITPRIDYYQGNKWWGKMFTMDDIHKPQLDSIGFQELTIDEMAAWDTTVDGDGKETFHSIGKQPSWIHYQTNQNEVYGNFARENAEQWMTLTRRYQWNENGQLKDGTTYIDPTQYNYPFAYVQLDSQPFWCQYGVDAKVRRIMSANQIPGF